MAEGGSSTTVDDEYSSTTAVRRNADSFPPPVGEPPIAVGKPSSADKSDSFAAKNPSISGVYEFFTASPPNSGESSPATLSNVYRGPILANSLLLQQDLANLRSLVEDVVMEDLLVLRELKQQFSELFRSYQTLMTEVAATRSLQDLAHLRSLVEDVVMEDRLVLRELKQQFSELFRSYQTLMTEVAATRSLVSEMMNLMASMGVHEYSILRRHDHHLLIELKNQLDAGQMSMTTTYQILKEDIAAIRASILSGGRGSIISIASGQVDNVEPQDNGQKNEVKSLDWEKLLKEGLAEAIAVFFSVLFSCTAQALAKQDPSLLLKAAASLTGGLVSVAQSYTFGDISGMHTNPIVTLCFASFFKFKWREVPIYIFCQLFGGFLASIILRFTLPQIEETSTMDPKIWWILISEILINMYMMYAKTAAFIKDRPLRVFGAFAVGSTQVLGSFLGGGSISGGVMNPVQCLACAFATKRYEHLWIYVVGAFIGTFVAAATYRYILLPEAKFFSKVWGLFRKKKAATPSNQQPSNKQPSNQSSSFDRV